MRIDLDKIIGRTKEKKKLERLYHSNKAQFLAIYGRRRIGKTHLIRSFFRDKGVYFEVTGSHGAGKKEQLRHFLRTLQEVFPGDYTFLEWDDAFDALRIAIQKSDPTKKHILFIDELPWFASPKSGFLRALDLCWNRYLSTMPNVLLVICGSAAHWMIKKVIQDKGGLHNRLTDQIRLEPFTLKETEHYLSAQGVQLNKKQIAELFMVFGGVANYLDNIPQGKSAAQIVNEKCFNPQNFLFSEFTRLYSSLFDDSRKHINVIRALANKPRRGLTLSEILKATSLSSGGAIAAVLEELEEAGFIMSQLAFGKRTKEKRYRLVDEYSLFYLRWIEPIAPSQSRDADPDYWNKQNGTAGWNEWAGYAFENLCLKHTYAIKHRLGISGVSTSESYFSYLPPQKSEERGAEIDLVITRKDNCTNLCEMKFTNAPFTIDKTYAQNLENKKDVFRKITHIDNALFTTLVTTYGLIKNIHASSVTEIVLDDLFVEKS